MPGRSTEFRWYTSSRRIFFPFALRLSLDLDLHHFFRFLDCLFPGHAWIRDFARFFFSAFFTIRLMRLLVFHLCRSRDAYARQNCRTRLSAPTFRSGSGSHGVFILFFLFIFFLLPHFGFTNTHTKCERNDERQKRLRCKAKLITAISYMLHTMRVINLFIFYK